MEERKRISQIPMAKKNGKGEFNSVVLEDRTGSRVRENIQVLAEE